jgi:hypothetical protein
MSGLLLPMLGLLLAALLLDLPRDVAETEAMLAVSAAA